MIALIGVDRVGFGALRRYHKNLQIDLVIGEIHAGRIVHGVSVDAAAIQGEFDARSLSETEVGAFSYNLGSKLHGVDARAIVGAVANDIIGLSAGLHISSHAAHPQ